MGNKFIVRVDRRKQRGNLFKFFSSIFPKGRAILSFIRFTRFIMLPSLTEVDFFHMTSENHTRRRKRNTRDEANESQKYESRSESRKDYKEVDKATSYSECKVGRFVCVRLLLLSPL